MTSPPLPSRLLSGFLLLSAVPVTTVGQKVTDGSTQIVRMPENAAERCFTDGDDHFQMVPATSADGSEQEVLSVEIRKDHEKQWSAGMLLATERHVHKGDLLEASFEARGIRAENGTPVVDCVFQLQKPPFTKSLQERVELSPEWKHYRLRFNAVGNYAPGRAKSGFVFAHQVQELQIRNFTLVGFGIGQPLLDPANFFERFSFTGAEYGSCLLAPVETDVPSFDVAVHRLPPTADAIRMRISPDHALRHGDRIEFAFDVGALSGSGLDLGCSLQLKSGGSPPWKESMAMAPGGDDRVKFAFVAPVSAAAGDWSLALAFGSKLQTCRIGGFDVIRKVAEGSPDPAEIEEAAAPKSGR